MILGTFDHVASEVLGIRLEKKANGKAILFRRFSPVDKLQSQQHPNLGLDITPNPAHLIVDSESVLSAIFKQVINHGTLILL